MIGNSHTGGPATPLEAGGGLLIDPLSGLAAARNFFCRSHHG
jgi:hypothetical protein